MSGEDRRRSGSSQGIARSVARLLRGASLLLALLFCLRVLLALGPIRSGPLWLVLRLCDALVNQAPFAVLMLCLPWLSLLLEQNSRRSRRLTRALKRLALPVAIGYLLLIPLYGAARWWRSQAENSALEKGLQASILQLEEARRAVLVAGSTEELQRILATLPAGSPPLDRFGADLDSRRSALVTFLDQVNRILMTRLQGLQQRSAVVLVRDTILYALACLGLAALFYRSSQIDLPRRRRPLSIAPVADLTGGSASKLRRDVERLIDAHHQVMEERTPPDTSSPAA